MIIMHDTCQHLRPAAAQCHHHRRIERTTNLEVHPSPTLRKKSDLEKDGKYPQNVDKYRFYP